MVSMNDIDSILNPIDTDLLAQRVQTWLATLEERGHRDSGYSYAFGIEKLTKYVRVWMDNVSPEGAHSGRSVHAFFDPATGYVYKASGWKAPAKGIRYCLMNPLSFDKLIERCGPTSGYLYADQLKG
jgi:hypothetical protein